MHIGLVQLDIQWENKELTKSRIMRIIESYSEKLDCLIFPEMTLSGFSMKQSITTLSSDDHLFFLSLANKINTQIIYGGVEHGYNCIFLVLPGAEVKTVYQKKHLFSFSGETENYNTGSSNSIVEVKGMKLSLNICYDLRFPYQFWSQTKNCDGYLIIANWPEVRREHWLTLLRARSIENQAFVIGVNRVGTDPKLNYSGDSVVYGPFGESLLECGSLEGMFFCELEPKETSEIRLKYQFIKDRLE